MEGIYFRGFQFFNVVYENDFFYICNSIDDSQFAVDWLEILIRVGDGKIDLGEKYCELRRESQGKVIEIQKGISENVDGFFIIACHCEGA